MVKAFHAVILLFFITLLSTGLIYAQAPVNTTETLINDLKDEGMEYKNFRTVQDEFNYSKKDPTPGEKPPSREGLSTLRASGSSEFSKRGLTEIKRKIPASRIIVVDLREESHGFINDRPVSWKNEHNNANKGKTLDEILNDEKARLQEAKRSDSSVKTACTEEELCHTMGVGYLRLPVTDLSGPDPSVVDRFISTVRSLPPDAWLHFHCKAGAGRTTTFMTLYDMMRNARKTSCEDIIMRQFLIGGVDLSGREAKGDAWYDVLARERDAFVKEFYWYCKNNDDGYKEFWSAWKKQEQKN